MCRNCYHRVGRAKIPINCGHSNRALYALGVCKQCYQANYTKIRNHKDDVDDSNISYTNDDIKIEDNKTKLKTEKLDDNKSVTKSIRTSLHKSSRSNSKYRLKEHKQESSEKFRAKRNKQQSLIKKNKYFDTECFNTDKILGNKNNRVNDNIKLIKENPFKIQKSSLCKKNSYNSNNTQDLFKLENSNNEIERMSSFNNSYANKGFYKGMSIFNNSEKNENFNSNNIIRNASNNESNNIINNINLQSYFNNLLTNNLPYYTYKGTFPNTNAEDYSIIEDFCGNFFQNYNQNNLNDDKSNPNYSDIEDFRLGEHN